jgi:hypothetical protein
MKKWFLIAGIILFMGGVAAFLIFSGSLYYKEDSEFKFVLKDTNGEYIAGYIYNYGTEFPVYDVVFLGKEENAGVKISHKLQAIFKFQDMYTGSEINLYIPDSLAGDINLSRGTAYKIYNQVQPPSSFCLIICQENELIFIGIADWRLDGEMSIDDYCFEFINPPIEAVQLGNMALRYKYNGEALMTNTSIEFLIDGESARMHQGESSEIGDYKINLMVARDVANRPGVLGERATGVSYTITKIK